MKFPLFKVAGILRASEKMVNAVTSALSDLAVQYYGNTVLASRLDDAELTIASFYSEVGEDAPGLLPDLSNLGKLLMNEVLQDAPKADGKARWKELLASLNEKKLVLTPADKESDYASLRDTVEQVTLLSGAKASKGLMIPTPTAEVIVPKEGLEALASVLRQMSRYPISNVDKDQKAKNKAARAELLSQLSNSLQDSVQIAFKPNRGARTQLLSADEYSSKLQELRNRTKASLAAALDKIDTVRSNFGISTGKGAPKSYVKKLSTSAACDSKELDLAKAAEVDSLAVVIGVLARSDETAYVPVSASQKTSSTIPVFFNAAVIQGLMNSAITESGITDPLELKEIVAYKWREVIDHELAHVVQAMYNRSSGGSSQMRGKMRYDVLDDTGILKKDLNKVVSDRLRDLTGKAKALRPSEEGYDAKIADLGKKRQDLADSLPLVREFENLRESYDQASTNKETFLPRMSEIAEHFVGIGLFPRGMDMKEMRIEHDSRDVEFFTELGNAASELDQHITAWAPDKVIGDIVKVFAGQATKAQLKESVLALSQQVAEAAAAIASASSKDGIRAAMSGVAFFRANNYLGSRQIADHVNSSAAFIEKMSAQSIDVNVNHSFELEQEQLDIALDQYKKDLSRALEIEPHKFFEHLYSRYKKYSDEVALHKWQRAASELYAHAIASRDAKFRVE